MSDGIKLAMKTEEGALIEGVVFETGRVAVSAVLVPRNYGLFHALPLSEENVRPFADSLAAFHQGLIQQVRDRWARRLQDHWSYRQR